MTADRTVGALTLVLAVGLTTACDTSTEPTVSTASASEAIRYDDPNEYARFKDALRDAKVPHELFVAIDGKEYVRWKSKDSATVARVTTQLFGEPLAPGRSLYLAEPRHKEFKNWLADNGIPFETQVNRGKEYVVWEDADYGRVAKWEHFPREQVDMVRRLSSNPTPHADARDMSAPASDSGARAGGRER